MNDVLRTLVTIVLFFGILGLLVLIHEVGHFVTARLFRVRFPPRARVLRNVGETVYTLNWLPIGGFVKLEGEDGDEGDDPRSFVAQPLWRKLVILVAGAAMNLVLAFVIFFGTIGLALAIAFGAAGREYAQKAISYLLSKKENNNIDQL